MQPEGMVLNTQIPGGFIKWRNWMGGVEDNFEHIQEAIIPQNRKNRAGSSRLYLPLQICLEWIIQLENGGLIDHNGAGLDLQRQCRSSPPH